MSYAGKGVLIKVVAQTTLIYVISVFKFPKNICNEIGRGVLGGH